MRNLIFLAPRQMFVRYLSMVPGKFVLICLIAATLLALFGCERRAPSITSIKTTGELRVAIEYPPHNYRLGDRVYGFQQELIEHYAAQLDVELKPVYVDSRVELMKLVQSRQVHLGIGMIPVTNKPAQVAFGPSFGTTELIVVTRTEAKEMQSRQDLAGRSLAVSFEEIVEDPFADDELEFFGVTAIPNASTDTLLALVASGDFDGAVVSAIDFLALQRKYPHLHQRFTLRESVPLTWLIATPSHPSFVQSLNQFIADLHAEGTLDRRWRYYFEHLKGFDFVEARAFARNFSERLAIYRPHFEAAAAKHQIDWRLLAAMSYQESHWNPDARSPTGVRGIMMLTKQTADELDVSRLNPAESIDGGTRYLATLEARLKRSIDPQDRLLMALAAYNVGWGHLQDARRIARHRGDDADRWQSVRENLPLLSREPYASQSRYGKARGGQAVHFVDGVRRYFAILRQLEYVEAARLNSETSKAQKGELLPL